MEFGIALEAQQLREELREFLRRELPPERRMMGIDYDEDPEGWAFYRQLKEKVAARGWLALSWPREYGGLGVSPLTQAVFTEEMAYQWAPGWDVFGVRMLGPVLMRFGTEEQKARFLPSIAGGKMDWCQGYSEPGSGSDLGSVQTRAVVDGDDFVINGAKIWTTHAHHADWMFLLARTDPDAPKHKGISFILLDMRSPGVSVSPITNMAGVHTINQVFFDNVRVPRENLVGEMDRGWYVGMALLDHERSAIEFPAWARRLIEETAGYVAQRDGDGALGQARRHALAERYIETEVGRAMSYRVAWSQTQGQVSNMEASIVKLFGSEVLQRATQTAMRALGLEGQLARRQARSPLEGWVPQTYMETISYTIFSGSSEIQRNIIATRGLGLPRG